MRVAGFMKQSFIDFPATIAAVIFTNGCNMNCWYCHNRILLDGTAPDEFSIDWIYSFLDSRKSFLDGVVISGGEPTLQPDLLDVITRLKQMGFKVKLDTNGSNPEVLEKALPLLDFVAMDIKTSPASYARMVGPVNILNIEKSKNLIMDSGCPYEFRCTFAPNISWDDVEELAKFVEGANRFALQTYRPQGESWPLRPPEDYPKALEIIKKYVKSAFIR